MKRLIKGFRITEEILVGLLSFGGILPKPFESVHSYLNRSVIFPVPTKRSNYALGRLQKRGVVSISNISGKKHVSLTKKGVLEALAAKMRTVAPDRWDGKWRMVIWDIPEDASALRDKLRRLLKTLGFKKLQASVFVSPYAIDRAGVEYLQGTGLASYIRILRVDEVDDDKDLRQMFGIK